MSEVEPRTRRELVREVVVSLVGALAGGALLFSARSSWPSTLKIGVVAAVIALLGLGLGLVLRRRRSAGSRPLDRTQRKQLRVALRGVGRLPDAADDSWRPALRQAVIGNSFAMYFVSYLALFLLLGFVPDSSDEPDGFPGSLTIAIILVLALGAMAVMLAGFLSWLSRLYADNALKMLDQLDARAIDRADA